MKHLNTTSKCGEDLQRQKCKRVAVKSYKSDGKKKLMLIVISVG